MSKTQKYYYIYRITNIIENKHYYGKHTTNLIPKLEIGIKYFSSSTDINFILDQKENPKNYKYKIVKICKDKETMNYLEVYLHNKFSVDINPKFYNKAKQTSKYYDASNIVTGTTVIIDKNGNKFRVKIDDDKIISGEYIQNNTNKTVVCDKNGNKFSVNINDPRFISGELVGHTSNRFVVCDKNGNKSMVTSDDPRFISGELISIHKNKMIVIDKNLNSFKVFKNDPRILSGELVSNMLGRNLSPDTCKNISYKTKGVNNSRFKKFYVTPFGIFDSPNALLHIISRTQLVRWCHTRTDTIISIKAYKNSKWLSDNYTYDQLKDKTYRDIGFYFKDL